MVSQKWIEISAYKSRRKKDHEFKTNLNYIVSLKLAYSSWRDLLWEKIEIKTKLN